VSAAGVDGAHGDGAHCLRRERRSPEVTTSARGSHVPEVVDDGRRRDADGDLSPSAFTGGLPVEPDHDEVDRSASSF
jgi:hypothetical protein